MIYHRFFDSILGTDEKFFGEIEIVLLKNNGGDFNLIDYLIDELGQDYIEAINGDKYEVSDSGRYSSGCNLPA